jgi:hypothetical protein
MGHLRCPTQPEKEMMPVEESDHRRLSAGVYEAEARERRRMVVEQMAQRSAQGSDSSRNKRHRHEMELAGLKRELGRFLTSSNAEVRRGGLEMKSIARRIRRLEERVRLEQTLRLDTEGRSPADVLRERLRRRAAAAGEPYEEPAPARMRDENGRLRYVADILRQHLNLVRERNRVPASSPVPER